MRSNVTDIVKNSHAIQMGIGKNSITLMPDGLKQCAGNLNLQKVSYTSLLSTTPKYVTRKIQVSSREDSEE
jgi:RNA-binding protein YlmH